MNSDSKKLIKFIKELEALKYNERQVYNQHNKGWENYAEHSWHTAMIVWFLSSKLEKRHNLERSLKLALMHDIVKLQTDENTLSDKAAAKILKNLPESLKLEMTKLYTEYKDTKTPESKLVNSANKLQPIILNLLTDGRSWKKSKITETAIREQLEPLVQDSPYLSQIFNSLLKEAADRKLIYRKFWERFVPKRDVQTKPNQVAAPVKTAVKSAPAKKKLAKKSTKTPAKVSHLKVQTV